jgi:putative MATE family efflux protein
MDGARREVIDIALPAIGSNILRLLVTTVDMIVVGRLGYREVDAVGISNILIFLFQAVMIAISAGAMVVVAHFFGMKKYDEANEVLAESSLLSLIIGVVLMIVGLIAQDPFISVMTDDPVVMYRTREYLTIVLLGVPFMSYGYLCANVFRGAGDTRTPLYVDAVANSLNAVFDVLLVFGIGPFPEMGVGGAAVATTMAFAVSAVMYALVFSSGNRALRMGLSMKRRHWREILYIGLPNSAEQIGIQVSNMIYTGMVSSLGPVVLAAHLIGNRIEALSFMPGFGFYTSSAVLVGQNLGRGDEEKAKRAAEESLRMSVILMGVLGLTFFFFPDQLSWIFVPGEPAVIETSRLYLRLMGVSQIFLALDFSMTGALRGAGNTMFPMYVTLIGRFAVRLVFAYVLGFVLHMGILGIWLGMLFDMIFKGVTVYAKFRKDGFKGALYASKA